MFCFILNTFSNISTARRMFLCENRDSRLSIAEVLAQNKCLLKNYEVQGGIFFITFYSLTMSCVYILCSFSTPITFSHTYAGEPLLSNPPSYFPVFLFVFLRVSLISFLHEKEQGLFTGAMVPYQCLHYWKRTPLLSLFPLHHTPLTTLTITTSQGGMRP